MIKAKEAGLPIIAMEQIKEIDLYIDGADEIAPDLTLLKGRGYDLVREKLLARSARKFIVIADESKLVKKIGDNFPIPSEVQPFAWELVKNILMKKGTGDIRINAAKDGYAITSCGNFVLDFNYPEKSTEELNALLSQTPGIVEHGIFYNIAHGALISSNGKVREIWKN
ncbi:MAG: Ribose-5-phosphate isomerase [Pseudomonadota bacterium]